RAFSYFINEELKGSAQDIFKAVMSYIQTAEGIDLQHLYIDGSKFEANANKYTWVWKKATEKSRYRLFGKITTLLTEMNETLAYTGLKIETNAEYTPDSLEMILSRYEFFCYINKDTFVHGRGHRKSQEQRYYERLKGYIEKLSEYVEKIRICGPDRNSYAKTDHDATVAEVMQYRCDMDCFVPLMEKFHELYGFYPKYPVADAGYGSFNNYLYCQEHGMEKFMKFPMYKKETTDEKYHDDPFRAVNFETDTEGDLICPNGRKFHFAYRKPVKGSQYGRQEEYYTCEDCSGCPYAEKCKKTEKNRTVRINAELSAMHQEVLDNLQSIHGALLRMNRSIQAEGTFGIIKYDRWYKRIVRRGLDSVRLELFLVSIGHNLYKYHNKQKRLREAA
uniref:transposase n=2 Tax=Enterocloster clostridioformis TaxID=1531 RepID=UPI0025A62567